MTEKIEFSALLAGVGGQGLMLLSSVIGEACAMSGQRIITGEQHGLSQRSGSISVHLRIGPEIVSPLIPIGSANAIISLEALETLRYIEYLEDDGIVLMNSRIMHPITETSQVAKDKELFYFSLEEIEKRLSEVTENVLAVDALSLARQAGNPLTENIVLLGAVCAFEAFPIPMDEVRGAISQIVPEKAREANLKAFELGLKASHARFCDKFSCKRLE